MEEEDAAIFVAEVTEACEFVGEGAVFGVFGEAWEDVCGVAHGLG